MLIIPIDSNLYSELEAVARSKRLIFMAGLLGTGKSLLIQQLALIASREGRKIHLLQYDIARKAFESPENLKKYPEVDGVTHPAIRKALGYWVRDAVGEWAKEHPEAEHLLIGELPLIGNRLIELAEPREDAIEAELAGPDSLFIIPVPSWEVREVIETSRQETLAQPSHELEARDARPNVMQALWVEVNALAREIGLTQTRPDTPYNPYIYGGVYQALLKHRQHQSLLLDQVLEPVASVYHADVVHSYLQASPDEVRHYIQQVETLPKEQLMQYVNNWHRMITDDPPLPDRGVALPLPLPEALTEVQNLALSPEQEQALQQVLDLSIDEPAEALLALLDRTLECFPSATTNKAVQAHKFDIYDSYFNVTRSEGAAALCFVRALLMSYRNVLTNMQAENPLTVVETALLRMGMDTALRQFEVVNA